MPSDKASSPVQPLKPFEMVALLIVSVAGAVIASMDQSTRGPSITAWLLTNGPSFFC